MITNLSVESSASENKKDFSFNTNEDFTPPPFIGCLLSDKHGKTIATFEVYKGALDFFIKKNMKDKSRCETFNLELIPMYFSALERFAEEINIQNVPSINLNGNNIKLHSILNLEHFTVIFFLNPLIHIKSYENIIYNYFIQLHEEFKSEFHDLKKLFSSDFVNHLELLGMEWINHLNDLYLEKSIKNTQKSG